MFPFLKAKSGDFCSHGLVIFSGNIYVTDMWVLGLHVGACRDYPEIDSIGTSPQNI
jgi:hypothetical protein